MLRSPLSIKSVKFINLNLNRLAALDVGGLKIFLGETLAQCPQLQQLDLEHDNLAAFDTERLKILGEALAKIPQLQQLHLNRNILAAFDTERLKILGEALAQCLQLQQLHLNRDNLAAFDAERLKILGEALAKIPQLQQLHLGGDSNPNCNNLAALDAGRLKILGEALVQCKNLKKIYLGNIFTVRSDGDSDNFCSFLSQCKNLTQIIIDNFMLNKRDEIRKEKLRRICREHHNTIASTISIAAHISTGTAKELPAEIHGKLLLYSFPKQTQKEISKIVKSGDAENILLAEIVQIGEKLRKSGQEPCYIFDEKTGSIKVSDKALEESKGEYAANTFNLSTQEYGRNKKVWYRSEAEVDFYGSYGFVHRLTQTARASLSAQSVASYENTEKNQPKMLARAPSLPSRGQRGQKRKL